MTFPRQVRSTTTDDLTLTEAEHQRALIGRSRLNRLTPAPDIIYRRLVCYSGFVAGRPLRVLDIASGRADWPIKWAVWALRDRIPLRITTIDHCQRAIDEQRAAASIAGVELNAIGRDCLRGPLPRGFDVITCSQFMHRLDDCQAMKLLQSMQAAADQALIVCDWERSRFNCWLVAAAACAVCSPGFVRTDAVGSVRSAFARQEFQRIAETALHRPVQCQGLVPGRFVMFVDGITLPAQMPAFA